jgi:methylenetetrahydrofolate dehydrogenase (NADP+)/methenyltetrahydrofolate cyclohydrolase
MKKELNGSELAEFIKERQAKAVRGLRQEWKVSPRLAIIRTNPDPVVDSYMRIKTTYGNDILVEVDVHDIDQSKALETVAKLNEDPSVHGIIVQIPLPDQTQTEEILNAVAPEKDVDGLAKISDFDAPTPLAINWLLSGYNIDLQSSTICILGSGRLVGAPLKRLWEQSGLAPIVLDKKSSNEQIVSQLQNADIIVSAAGAPSFITPEMVSEDAIIVDAGVSTDSNGLVGDVSQEVRDMPGVTITPVKGGVGPLTVAALFENVIIAARQSVD